jgi:hypothetical protein
LLDDLARDRVNTVILWLGGAFRSRKYPITWQYNAEHLNIREDFMRRLIRHAHRRGIQCLLGFTPFGYDGVNQYPLEHPELKATGPDGKPVTEFGIHCWGWNLCPAKPEAQRFMLRYARELAFEFYPEADGLFIESSDYAICHCPECGPRHFDHEFQFVRTISEEAWARKPGATIVVYPHYFSGAKLRFSFAEAIATKQPFDPRWTLFFTPHSAAIEPGLIAQAKGSWWWNEAPTRLGQCYKTSSHLGGSHIQSSVAGSERKGLGRGQSALGVSQAEPSGRMFQPWNRSNNPTARWPWSGCSPPVV